MATKPAAKSSNKPAQQQQSQSRAVATKAAFEISAERPEFMGAGPGRGNENVGIEDLVVPRLELIQALSPAVKRGDPKQIEGAQQGQMNNSVTRELYGDSVVVVPVHYSKQWLVWRDQKKGGGFGGAYNTEREAMAKAKELGGEAQGYEVIDTPQHLCLLLNGNTGKAEEIMLPLPKTKAKVSRGWNSMIRLAEGDRFSRAYKITTALETNNQNQSYYNFVVQPLGFVNQAIFAQAEKLYTAIASGKTNVVMDTEDLDTADEGGTEM